MNLRVHRLAVAEIPYQITAEEITILALAHTRRRPGYWSRRRDG